MAKKKKKKKNIVATIGLDGKVTKHNEKNNDGRTSGSGNNKKTVVATIGLDGKITKHNNKKTEPIKTTKKRKYFNKGLFEDGYDFGDVTKTILGTAGDILVNPLRGAAETGTGLAMIASGGVGRVAEALGKDKYAAQVRKRIEDVDNMATVGKVFDAMSTRFDKSSLLGEKTDDLLASVGGLGAAYGTQAILKVPATGVLGASSAGQELGRAYKSGATEKEAWTSAAVAGISEAAFEKLGGIKFGGKALDDKPKKWLSQKIANKTAQTLAKFGMDAGIEGFEEVATAAAQRVGQNLTYEDEETLLEYLTNEEAIDQYIEGAIGGFVIGGGFNIGKTVGSIKSGRDYDTGLTANEQSVVDREVSQRTIEKRKEAAVSARIDAIIKEEGHEDLSPDEKKSLRDSVLKELEEGTLDYSTAVISKKELREIEKQVEEDLKSGNIGIESIESIISGEKTNRIKELQQELESADDTVKANLEEEIKQLEVARAKEMLGRIEKDSYLQESYRQEMLKGKAFSKEATDKDSDITKELIKSAKAAGMNDTRKMHDLFEYTNKIANDSKTKYAFTNTEQLKRLGHHKEGKTINGLVRVSEDGNVKVLINVDSAKALNTIIGHETTHLLEGSNEYKALQRIVKEYATTKGEYDSRLKEISELYKGTNANLENEITADLVGDYLFTDEQFIHNLSTKEPNVFKRIYDYIKHAYKMATAGSTEKRQLEQVKRKFDKAYKQISKTATKTESDTEYSLTKYTQKQLDNWKNSKSIVIYESDEQLNEFVSDAKAGELGNKKMYFGVVPEALADRVMEETGVDIKNRNVTLGAYEVQKIFKDHGDEAKEALRGQRAVTEADFENILDVIESPENIELSLDTYNGRPVLHFSKTIGDKVTVVSYDSIKHYDLRVQTIYINKKRSLASATDEQASVNTSETTSGTAPINNIPAKEEIVNADTDYMAAIEEGDMKSAQNMVQKAAAEAMPNTAAKDENGMPREMYHGTSEKFNAFNMPEHEGAYGRGIYFTDVISEAADYAIDALGIEENAGVYTWDGNEYDRGGLEDALLDSGYIKAAYVDVTAEQIVKSKYGDGEVAVVTDVKKIKSADPVTYDDKGNVIPLSERFNTDNEDIRYSLSESNLKAKQLDIILKSNPAHDDWHTWIRNVDDIKTFEETLQDSDWAEYVDEGFNPDYTGNMVQEALSTGKITVYSSYPIENGIFVSPSRMEAESYAGSGRIYSKEVNLTDVAWVDPTQGQYAKAEDGYYVRESGLEPEQLELKFNMTPKGIELTKEAIEYLNGISVANKTDANYVKTTAKGFMSSLIDNGTASIVGRQVSSANELAHVAQVFRDPRYETMRYFFTDDEGKVVFQTGVTSRLPGSAIVFEGEPDEYFDRLNEAAKKAGATKVWILHNHPSGNPQPSQADISATISLMELFDYMGMSYQGHVVINSNQYAEIHIDPVAEKASASVYGLQLGEDKLLTPEIPSRELGEYITSIDKLAQIAKAMQRDKDISSLIYTTAKGEIRAIQEFNNAYKDLEGLLKENIVNFGSPGVFIATESEEVFDNAEDLIRDGLILDAVLISGEDTTGLRGSRGVYPERNVLEEEHAAERTGGETNFSLSDSNGIAPIPIGNYNVYGKDVLLPVVKDEPAETAPAEEVAIAPVVEDLDSLISEWEGYAELPYNRTKLGGLSYAEQVAQVEKDLEFFRTIEEDSTQLNEPTNPLEADGREIEKVGDRKVKAYMYENPEVKPFFQEEAKLMLTDLKEYSVKGERHYSDTLYDTGDESHGFTGTKRFIDPSIGALIDEYKYTREEVEKGLRAIIEDHGAENNAVSKRLEFLIDERLREGYTDMIYGDFVPPNEDYINLLESKQITEYSDEAYEAYLSSLAGVEASETTTEDIGPIEDETEDIPKKTKKELQKELLASESNDIVKALEKAKNIPMALMNNTDTIRNNELVLGREASKKVNEAIFQKAIDNEARSIYWQNKQRADIKALGIKARSKESAAVQKYGEGEYVNEFGDLVQYGEADLMMEFPNEKTQEKIKEAARFIKLKYEHYIDQANGILTGLGFDPIPKRKDYMRHFQELNDVFSKNGLPFNPQNMKEHVLPTDINGLTEFWSPQKNFFANMQPRKGLRTTLDAITGIDGYIGGIANLIFHTEDIQRGRAYEGMIRENFGEERGWDILESLPEDQQAARAELIGNNHLSNYAAWVHEWTNNLAGKKNKVDRSIEAMFGRKGFTVLDTIRKQIGANMIGFNVASSLTNLISPIQAISKTNKLAAMKGTVDTFRNIVSKDDFVNKNAFLTSRFGTDMLSKTPWQKVQDAAYIFMKGVDYFSANLIVRSKYNELIKKGMSEKEAHKEAGRFAARIMGDRTKGANAQLYNSKMIGVLTQFQLEVNNQLYSMFYDTYHDSKENAEGSAAKAAAGMTFVLGQLFAFTHVFGKAFDNLAGYNPTFDVLGIVATLFGVGEDDEEEKTFTERSEAAMQQLIRSLPYASIFTGGRIPIGSALPIKQLFEGKDEYGNDKSRVETLKETVPYYIMPGGYNQLKKTAGGIKMFDEDNPVAGSYTDSGNLRFPIDESFLNKTQAAVFGQWANKSAQDYIDNERAPLKEKQIEEYKELKLPIADYWKIREGLKGKDNADEKFDYIAGLDLPVDKKNILINNAVNRKEEIDMEDYDDYGSFAEFDFAMKNPEKYAMSQVVGGYKKYKRYSDTLYNIKANKDENGESVRNSRKLKVANYIRGLEIPDVEKYILFKSEYNSDDTHNREILDYLYSKENITNEQREAILKQLGFEVSGDTVYW